ncbi:polysaccharide pyruvyl transferase family protein [Pontibacterium sp.]|uniref:polysaccharide pyruvyl transferase family protein n=1 Tax=Pontibacterium sp. TaxID=2036026 RepID=UPI003563EE24
MDKLKIGLLWHSLGSSNLGIGALTVSQMKIIAAAAKESGIDYEFHLICWPPEEGFFEDTGEPIVFHYMKARHFVSLKSPLRRWIKECDIVFDIGAGDSFADLYGTKRFLYLFLTKIFSVMYRVPLVLSPQTIGPFYNPVNRFMAKCVMRLAKKVYARDEKSFNYLKSIGVTKNINMATDVAFLLPFDKAEMAAENGKLNIGLNVSALLYSQQRSGSDRISLSVDFKSLVDQIIERLQKDDKYNIYLVPHVNSSEHQYENDHAVSVEIANKYPGVQVAPEFFSPCVAKSFISGLDLLIGARMHATIAGISSGVPILPLSYSRKFTGLYETLGYPYICDLNNASNEDAIVMLEKVLSDLHGAKSSAEKSQELAVEKLAQYQLELQALLKTL